MKDPLIPEAIVGFIVENFDSIGKLEVLLLLADDPSKSWTANAVGKEMRSNDSLAEKYLKELASQGLLELEESSPAAYRGKARTTELDQKVKELVAYYATYKLRIIQLIYSRPMERILGFADAFKIRKDN